MQLKSFLAGLLFTLTSMPSGTGASASMDVLHEHKISPKVFILSMVCLPLPQEYKQRLTIPVHPRSRDLARHPRIQPPRPQHHPPGPLPPLPINPLRQVVRDLPDRNRRRRNQRRSHHLLPPLFQPLQPDLHLLPHRRHRRDQPGGRPNRLCDLCPLRGASRTAVRV